MYHNVSSENPKKGFIHGSQKIVLFAAGMFCQRNPVEMDRDKMGHYIFTLQIYYVYASSENLSKLYNNLVADKKVIIEQNVYEIQPQLKKLLLSDDIKIKHKKNNS